MPRPRPVRHRLPLLTSPVLVALCAALAFTLWALDAHAQPVVLQGLKLVDQRGQALKPASLQGRVLLLNFVFTGCSATCPLQVRELALLHAALPAAVQLRVGFLSVSVDPMNDTPATLAHFAKAQGADLPGWRFATGAPTQVGQLLERLRVLDQRDNKQPAPADHRTTLFLFNAQGELVQRFAGVPVDRVRLAREITQLATSPRPSPQKAL